MKFKYFYNIRVAHCYDAWGLVLQHQSGWKIVYTGDSQPSANVVDHAQNATLLIHEATMKPKHAAEAAKRRHSTDEEALEVAAATNAYRVILTHFSMRRFAIPVENLQDSASNRVTVAFDMMTVNMKNLPLLPSFLPALKLFRVLLKQKESDEYRQHCENSKKHRTRLQN